MKIAMVSKQLMEKAAGNHRLAMITNHWLEVDASTAGWQLMASTWLAVDVSWWVAVKDQEEGSTSK